MPQVRKDIKAILDRMNKLQEELNNLNDKIDPLIDEICEFDAGITNCGGDGFLVINMEHSNVALLSCLIGKSKKNKLTKEEFNKYSI